MSKKKKKPIKKSETFKIVRIDWKDHNSGNHSWRELPDIVHRPLHCVSVGVLIKEDKDGVTLAQSMGHNMDIVDTIFILKDAITHRKVLGEVEYGEAT